MLREARPLTLEAVELVHSVSHKMLFKGSLLRFMRGSNNKFGTKRHCCHFALFSFAFYAIWVKFSLLNSKRKDPSKRKQKCKRLTTFVDGEVFAGKAFKLH